VRISITAASLAGGDACAAVGSGRPGLAQMGAPRAGAPIRDDGDDGSELT
jgi:hypothetical protein